MKNLLRFKRYVCWAYYIVYYFPDWEQTVHANIWLDNDNALNCEIYSFWLNLSKHKCEYVYRKQRKKTSKSIECQHLQSSLIDSNEYFGLLFGYNSLRKYNNKLNVFKDKYLNYITQYTCKLILVFHKKNDDHHALFCCQREIKMMPASIQRKTYKRNDGDDLLEINQCALSMI